MEELIGNEIFPQQITLREFKMGKNKLVIDDANMWEFLRWNTCVSTKHKLIYIATPKVGCTSLKWWFAALEGVSRETLSRTESGESDADLAIHDTLHKVAPHVTGLVKEPLAEFISSDEYLKFALVRNPYRRLFSAWQSKILLQEPLQVEPYRQSKFFNLPIDNFSDIAIAFEMFLEHLAEKEAPCFLDVHWTPQVVLLRPDVINYSKLVKIENPQELSQALTVWLGDDISDPFAAPRINESLIPCLPEFFTERTIELISSLYAEDFDAFEYSKLVPHSNEKFSTEQLNIALRSIALIRGRHQRLNEVRSSFAGQIGILNQALNERDGQIGILNQALSERDGQIGILNQALNERDGQIGILNQALSERDGQIGILNQALSERDGQIGILNQALNERDGQIGILNQALSERDGQILQLTHSVVALKTSASWRITRPIRLIGQPLMPAAKLSRVAIKTLQLGGGVLGTAKLAVRVLRKDGISGIAWRLGNVRALLATDTRSLPLDRIEKKPSVVFGERRNNDLSQNYSGDYVALATTTPLTKNKVKLICFYLPQFHSIQENDAWWGKDFTEWSNVRPAQPQFVGHYQPHVPDELGYYNLLDAAVQQRQVDLAKLYGIGGFCFYFYWFGGKRLLEAPIQNYLNDSKLDLPFCLCWANENWTRRWDGLDSEILIAQQYSDDDDLAFIEHIAQYMFDQRYIRIDGKPLLLVYRPSLLPSAMMSATRWRQWCRDKGIGEIYLAYPQSFETVDPAQYGFDAAIEFPPNNSSPPNISNSVTPLSKNSHCTVYDWRIFVERSEKYTQPDYKLFRSVCPSWDNTARRKSHGTIFLNNTPGLYKKWLENAIQDTIENNENKDERLIFVNAWNEWAEGAHLEPDAKYGYAWLQATSDALVKAGSEIPCRRIIVVSHDAHPHGAQYLALHLARTLSSDFGFQVALVLLGEGMLTDEYSQWATVHNLTGQDPRGAKARALAGQLVASGHQAAIVNTTVSGFFLETLEFAGIRCVSLVHELKGVIETNNLQEHAAKIAKNATAIVFPAQQVADSFFNVAEAKQDKIKIRHQGLYKSNSFLGSSEVARKRLREALGLDEHAKIMLGVGYADYRKGIDYFVEIGINIAKKTNDTFFVWVGHWDFAIQKLIEKRLSETQLQDRFLFVGRKSDTDMYYAGADIYALTSREDPFPSVVMESLEVAVPVIGFKGAGGFDELLEKGCGILVKAYDISAFSDVALELFTVPEKAHAMGSKGAQIIEEAFSFRHYIYDLLDFLGLQFKRISVIVPNYNYAQYLDQRLGSIACQTYPIFEIIVLDDSSTDNSIDIIKNCLANTTIDSRLIKNNSNSGSVFKQWQYGVENARGDYIWICEADDYAAPELVERSIALFCDDQVVMTYTQSLQIDERGRMLADNYLAYTDDICRQKWLKDHVSNGMDELCTALSVKNTIPNVSAVIFRKSALQKAMLLSQNTLYKLRIAGDWLIYAHVMQDGKIGYLADSLNFHRRHQDSVTTSSSSNARHLAEVIFMQGYVAKLRKLDEGVTVKAKKYVDTIYAQFSLDPIYANNPTENRYIKEFLLSFN